MTTTRRQLLKNSALAIAAMGLTAGMAKTGFAMGANGEITLTSSKTWTVGDIKCTALLDGIVQLDAQIFGAADPEMLTALLSQAGHPQGKINLNVNAYLIETGNDIVLIDTGTRDLFGPTLGKLPEQLISLGKQPDDITKIILTHMHNDHTGGLVTATGEALFKNAELIVPAEEWDFWTSQEIFESTPEANRSAFIGARSAQPAYTDRVRVISGEKEVLPGIHALPLFGHSIGHTGYRLASGKDQMIIWGDAVVSPALQFVHPEWTSVFDADPEASIVSRKRIFDETSADKILVAGMHLPFPGVGYVSRKGNDYSFESAVIG